jgi:hypothetical protein
MHLHLAAARFHALGHAVELFGHIMMEDDIIASPIEYSGERPFCRTVPAGVSSPIPPRSKKYRTAETSLLRGDPE